MTSTDTNDDSQRREKSRGRPFGSSCCLLGSLLVRQEPTRPTVASIYGDASSLGMLKTVACYLAYRFFFLFLCDDYSFHVLSFMLYIYYVCLLNDPGLPQSKFFFPKIDCTRCYRGEG